MPKSRGGTSYRLSECAQDLLAKLSERLGVTKTGVLEMAIRKLARTELGEVGWPANLQGRPETRLSVEAFARQHKN
jgi:hypothetical protein